MIVDWTSIVTVLILISLVIAVGPALGDYIARVYLNRPVAGDSILNPVERVIFRFLGVSPREGMRVGSYVAGLLLVNASVMIWMYLVLVLQNHVFPTQPGFTPMTWDLALHTSASFTTNTDFTHFSNEGSATMWGALLAFMVPFFTSAGSGLCVAAAFARGFIRKDGTLGNVYVDLVRTTTRILLPISVLGALFYILLNVPDTLTYYVTAAGPSFHGLIFLGPVAPWQSIELLGTNGGGFYFNNAGSVLATPTAYVTDVGIVLMLLLPVAIPFAFGYMVRRPGEAYPIVGAMLAVFFVAFLMFGFFEATGNLLNTGYRFPYPTDSAFQIVSIYSNTGATNLTLGQLNPLAQMVVLFGMFTQSTPGGDGTGFGTLLVNLLIAVFVGGLMVGRTPEYLGKKIGMAQVKWSAMILIIHPIVILVPTAIAMLGGFVNPGTFAGSNGYFCTTGACTNAHNFTTVLYEFTSEAANNGSGMALNDNTVFFNVAGAIVMILGRFVPIIGMLAIAGHFADQDALPPGPGTLRTRSLTFMIYLTLILIVITALLFLPVLALGPLSQIGG
jgi:K+-transporting ATPase ATPase A chain